MLFCPNTDFSHGGGLEIKALYPTTCDKDRNKLQGPLLEETLQNLVKHQSPSYQRDSPGSHAITSGRSSCEFPPNVVFQTSWAWERLCTKTKSVWLANPMGNEACEATWHRKPNQSLPPWWLLLRYVQTWLSDCFASLGLKSGVFSVFTSSNEQISFWFNCCMAWPSQDYTHAHTHEMY